MQGVYKRTEEHKRKSYENFKTGMAIWTRQDTQKLKVLVGRGKLSNGNIAKILNRSSEAIRHRLSKLGLENNFLKSEVNVVNWTKQNMMWLAGFLEGEGCFSIKRASSHAIDMTVSSIDLDILEKAKNIAGCGKVYEINTPSAKKLSDKQLWAWRVWRQAEAYALMVVLFDFMGKRRKEQIKKCIENFKNKTYYQRRKANAY